MTVANELELLMNTKADIASAITEKGVAVPAGTPFSGYPELIRGIGSRDDNITLEIGFRSGNADNGYTNSTYQIANPLSTPTEQVASVYWVENDINNQSSTTTSIPFVKNGSYVDIADINKSGIVKVYADFRGYSYSNSYLLSGSGLPLWAYNYLEEVELRNLLSVGDRCLSNCFKLQKVVLPDNLASIEEYFMWNCMAFEGPLIIPGSVKSIGNSFMEGCDNLESLYIGAGAVPPTDNRSLTSYSGSSAYINGIKLYGPGAAAWKEALPDINEGNCRKLILAN